MLSLNSLLNNSFFPALFEWSLYESQINRDLRHLYSAIKYEQTEHHVKPNYSLVRKDQQAHLEVELPGVSKENVNLDIIGKKLVITAKRFRADQNIEEKADEELKDPNADDIEDGNDTEVKDAQEQPKPSVLYQLKIRIGPSYDTENIQASMDGYGILKMILPLKKKENPRKIEIN